MTNSGNKYKFATIMKNRSTKKTVTLQKKLKSGKFGKPREYEMFGGETTAEDVIKRLEKSNPDSTWRIAEAAEETVEEAVEEAPVKKTKTFMACVTLNGKVEVLTMEYPTKKAFAADIRANGYKIQFISTPEKFDEDCEKYHEAVEKTKRIHKAQYDTYKNSAMRNEITFKEWRAWLKAE